MQLNTSAANRHRQAEQVEPLLLPYRLGDLELGNRLVMAPMTRSRALSTMCQIRLPKRITSSAPPPD